MKDEADFFRSVYSDPGISVLVGHYVNYNCARIRGAVTDALGTETLADDQEFSIRMYAYGSIYMTRE